MAAVSDFARCQARFCISWPKRPTETAGFHEFMAQARVFGQYGVLKSKDLRILKTPPHSPLCNAYAERHVREIRETLDNLILLGDPHLRRALAAIQGHHNAQRPHQGIGNIIPLDFDYPAEPALPAQVRCESALGGLLNSYSIKQAA